MGAETELFMCVVDPLLHYQVQLDYRHSLGGGCVSFISYSLRLNLAHQTVRGYAAIRLELCADGSKLLVVKWPIATTFCFIQTGLCS